MAQPRWICSSARAIAAMPEARVGAIRGLVRDSHQRHRAFLGGHESRGRGPGAPQTRLRPAGTCRIRRKHTTWRSPLSPYHGRHRGIHFRTRELVARPRRAETLPQVLLLIPAGEAHRVDVRDQTRGRDPRVAEDDREQEQQTTADELHRIGDVRIHTGCHDAARRVERNGVPRPRVDEFLHGREAEDGRHVQDTARPG